MGTAREGRGSGQGWVEVGKGGKMGTSVTVSTIKIKLKKIGDYTGPTSVFQENLFILQSAD